jgi:alkylated DNA repair protein alkB family protein 4
MESNIKCPCKGIRTCAICEEYKEKLKLNIETINIQDYIHIDKMGENIEHFMIKPTEDLISLYKSIQSTKTLMEYEKYIDKVEENIFAGFYTIKDLLTPDDITKILNEVNQINWQESQSGRKKQDFGPKINYKKRKVKFSDTKDFPKYSQLLADKLNSIEFLKDFKVAEIGNLLYTKNTGAHIEPHIDDYWIWGNFIIGINLLSKTVMTFTYETGENLYELNFEVNPGDVYVMSEEARYIWKHSVKKENITEDRIVITLREYYKNYIK